MIEAVFVGLPASGKTTVGKILARYLDSDFADSDTLIEEATGKSIPELFEERGEDGFREVEAEVIAQALDERSGVLSLGLVFGLYKLAMNSFGSIFTLFGTAGVSFLPYALPMLGAFIAIGVCAGIFGSIFSMRRYLKEHGGSVVSNDNE